MKVLHAMVFLFFEFQEIIPSAGLQINESTVLGRFSSNAPNTLAHAGTKYSMPRALTFATSRSSVSFSRPTKRPTNLGEPLKIECTIKHPSGAQLFTTNSGLAGLFDTFLNGLEADPYFTVFFSQLHLLILHQIYQYLLRIYATFNLATTPELELYLDNQALYALNKKTIIINHLFNIIEAQINGAITTKFPRMPQEIASNIGTLLMKHDYGTNLNIMLEEYETQMFSDAELLASGIPASEVTLKKEMFKNIRSRYSKQLGNYLRFMKEHCSYVSQSSTSKPFSGLNQFVENAQKIKDSLDIELKAIASQASDKTKQIDTLNPPLFFYDTETMRGLKVIPVIAQSLPSASKAVDWPTKVTSGKRKPDGTFDSKTALVNMTFGMAASESSTYGPSGSPYNNKRIAFYAQPDGTITNATAGPRLFVRIMTAEGLYAQELYKQPEWLNSYDGVIAMMRACLGDFTILLDHSALRDETILDPCITCVLTNASQTVGIKVKNNPTACNSCAQYIKTIKEQVDIYKKSLETSVDADTPPPDISASTDDLPAGIT